MIIRPRMVHNVRAFGARFHVSDAFLFSSDERSAYVIPWTGGGAKLWYRKLLLEHL